VLATFTLTFILGEEVVVGRVGLACSDSELPNRAEEDEREDAEEGLIFFVLRFRFIKSEASKRPA